MSSDALQEARKRMGKAVDSTRHEFATLRTGRANPSLLDRVMVDYYGTMTPLKQIAQVGAPEARLLSVVPFDKSALKNVEKAITESDLGLNPNNDGTMIRLQIPQLTEERRKEIVRIARNRAEEGRIAVRNVRRDVLNDGKAKKKDGEIGEDDLHRLENSLQKVTDEYVGHIDEALKSKEAEIMEV